MEFSKESLESLRGMLNAANVSDDYLSRGVQLTQNGIKKVAAKFNISEYDVPEMLAACAKFVSSDLQENTQRYVGEPDYIGNITLRDTQTGREIYLSGEEAFRVIGKLDRNPLDGDSIISPYFNKEPLQESDDVEVATGEPPFGASTYNFPYRGGIATAMFWMDGPNKKIKVVSYRDHEDKDLPITPDMNRVALTWWDKV